MATISKDELNQLFIEATKHVCANLTEDKKRALIGGKQTPKKKIQETYKFTRDELFSVISESVKGILKEYDIEDCDEQDSFDKENYGADAVSDFKEYGFEDGLKYKFPDKVFDCECEYDGSITVTEYGTGNVYYAQAEEGIESVSLFKPSSVDYDAQDETNVYAYHFDDAFKEICEKIQNNQPDDINSSYRDEDSMATLESMSKKKALKENLKK